MDIPRYVHDVTLAWYRLKSCPENNTDSQPGEIDLHGLFVKEAIEYTDQAILAAQSRGDSEIHLIVGSSIHLSIPRQSFNKACAFYRKGHSLAGWSCQD